MAQLTAEHMPIPTLRVGIDLVRVADIASSIARFGDRYVERVFTAGERSYCDADGARSAERFAARFAAKEATLKVLRPSAHDGVDLRSIEVRQVSEGACEIVLFDAALELAQRAGVVELSLSMSHEHEYATAMIVARLLALPVAAIPRRWTVIHSAPRTGSRHAQTSWDA